MGSSGRKSKVAILPVEVAVMMVESGVMGACGGEECACRIVLVCAGERDETSDGAVGVAAVAVAVVAVAVAVAVAVVVLCPIVASLLFSLLKIFNKSCPKGFIDDKVRS